jgi:histidinol-phosphate aminotransferase
MSTHLRPHIARLQAYVPGEQIHEEGIIKLNTNENPYPPSPQVMRALRRAIDSSLRLYPEPLSDTLRNQAAVTYAVEAENILAGNGSDELLSILVRCLIGKGDRVAYPVPTYTLYDTLVNIQEGESLTVDYPPDFSLPEGLAAQKAALTFLCNPNSPSGTLLSRCAIERLAAAVTGVLVVDEAYIDFTDNADASAIPLVKRFPNLVVLRSFSKSFSLAGMRIGLAFGAREMIAGLMKVKDSYNLNRLSIIAATAALRDQDWMKRTVKRIQRARRQLSRRLTKLGFSVYPSQANFVLARRDGHDLRPVYEHLKSRKIVVRYFDVPGLKDALRITVGTSRQVQALTQEIETIGTASRGNP